MTPEDEAYMQALSDRLCAATGTPTVPVAADVRRGPCLGCNEFCGQCDVEGGPVE